jgi:hypothetical protein
MKTQHEELAKILQLCSDTLGKLKRMQLRRLEQSATYSSKDMQKLLKHLFIVHKVCQEMKPIRITSRKFIKLGSHLSFGSINCDQSGDLRTFTISGGA